MTVTSPYLEERVTAFANCTGDVANELSDLAEMLPPGSQERQELVDAVCCYDKAAAAERRALGHIERARRAA